VGGVVQGQGWDSGCGAGGWGVREEESDCVGSNAEEWVGGGGGGG